MVGVTAAVPEAAIDGSASVSGACVGSLGVSPLVAGASAVVGVPVDGGLTGMTPAVAGCGGGGTGDGPDAEGGSAVGAGATTGCGAFADVGVVDVVGVEELGGASEQPDNETLSTTPAAATNRRVRRSA